MRGMEIRRPASSSGSAAGRVGGGGLLQHGEPEQMGKSGGQGGREGGREVDSSSHSQQSGVNTDKMGWLGT